MSKRLNVRLSDAEHKRFKLACVKADREMSDVLRELIEQFVKGKKVAAPVPVAGIYVEGKKAKT